MDLTNAWWPASRPDQVFRWIPSWEVDKQAEEMRAWTGWMLNDGPDHRKWSEQPPILTREKMRRCWHKLAVVRRREIPPMIAER